MSEVRFRFERFVLEPADRRLRRDDVPVDLNARYLDALALLVRERGRLVSKDRFHDEVWRGVPVTDEALTQCIRTLRRQLGDDASRPQFIETVPKYGYRFIAPVEELSGEPAPAAAPAPATPAPAAPAAAAPPSRLRLLLLRGGAATLGAGLAGVAGGLFYGFVGASQPTGGIGAVSVLLVLVWLTIAAALTGGAGVGFGIAAASLLRNPLWRIAGGALGGMVVGGMAKLLGLDAFNLLFGRTPGDITGGAEGALLGAAVGFGAWFAGRGGGAAGLRRSVAAAGAAGAAAGIVIPLLGGRLMGGSLDLLARQFPESRMHPDQFGHLFGEQGFGPVTRTVTSALEGALFAACIVAALVLAERSRSPVGAAPTA